MTASKEMLSVAKELEALGHETTVPDFAEDYAELDSHEQMHSESYKNKINHDLIRGYYDKIDASDAVLIMNIDRKGIEGYVGGNSFLEMGFAHVLNKKLYLWKAIPEMGYKDEMIAMQPEVLNEDLQKLEA